MNENSAKPWNYIFFIIFSFKLLHLFVLTVISSLIYENEITVFSWFVK